MREEEKEGRKGGRERRRRPERGGREKEREEIKAREKAGSRQTQGQL